MTTPATSVTLPPGPTDARRTYVAIRRNTLKFFCDLYNEYGDIAHYQIGPRRVYLISNPADIRTVLLDLNDKMERTQLTHDTIGKFIGQGLTVSAGSLHKKQRRTIQPAFTPTWITSYADTMLNATLQQMETWEDGQTIDIAAEMMNLTMNIVYRTIFGNRTNQADQQAKDAITLLQKYAGEMLIGAVTITEEQCDAAKAILNSVVDDLIREHKEHEQSDFLDLLLKARDPETGHAMSDEQIRAEAINFYIAGQETSANALAWSWYELAEHPEIQHCLDEELDSVLGASTVSLQTLGNLQYTERVLKESMRILPPAWLIGRRPTENVEIAGYNIDPEASIAICSYAFHRNPTIFPEPDTFNPDRFLTDPPKYAYLPFGAGAHICIGQPFAMLETSFILSTIAQHFWIEPAYDQPVEPEPLITLRPKNGIKVRLTKRK